MRNIIRRAAVIFSLALIPVVGLLLMIYFNDKKEKEPFGLLIAIFFAGVGSVIPALILEKLGGMVIGTDSMIEGILHAMIIVGPAEELSKFLVLFLITWKNKNFNYSYDAIVYAVFASLGFAAIENIGYTMVFGAGTALLRMFTSIPGHACFGVYMGFFYSRAKYAKLTKKNGKFALHLILAMLIPTLIHGVYDAILMGGGSSDEIVLAGITLILWLIFMAGMFASSIVLIVKSSKNDFCIVEVPDKKEQTIYIPNVVGVWTCTCGSVNYLNFCGKCGRQRQVISSWTCPNCWTLSTYNFCGKCGCPKPADQGMGVGAVMGTGQQPYGQTYGQPYGQTYGQTYGQPYGGQTYNQPYNPQQPNNPYQ